MKKYIFIAMTICDIGGSEQYIFNKTQFLKEKGYQTFVFSALNRPILIKDFHQYTDLIFPALMYDPYFFRKQEVLKIVERIIAIISPNETDEIIIETDSISSAKWGEMLAEKLGAKHFIFDVQEIHNYSDEEKEFLKFKLARHELAGILPDSVRMMLKDESLPLRDDMAFLGFCNNVVQDCPSEHLSQLWADARMTFGSIGRLEKGYLNNILIQLAQFCKANPKDKFNLLLIGGTRQRSKIKQIKGLFEGINNVNLVITGYLYPIPSKLIKSADVFISTAGAATVSYWEDVPTIKVHPVSGRIAGIIGFSFDPDKDSMFNETDEDLIETILKIERKKIPIKYVSDPHGLEIIERRKEFNRQLEVVLCKNADSEYYNAIGIRPLPCLRTTLYRLMGKTLGSTKMQNLLEQYRLSK